MLARFFARLLNVIRPGRAEPDLAREIAAHLALLEHEYRGRGLSPDDARRAARMAIGGLEQTKERQRDARAFVWLEDLKRDVFYAGRLLRRNPIFTLTSTLSLAIGVGAATTVFGAANTLLFSAAPGIAEPHRLVDINRTTGELGVQPLSETQYLEIRERATLLDGVFAYSLVPSPMSLASGQEGAEPVFGGMVTLNYFTALGVAPSAGRVFGEHDSEPVVVLSHRFWTRRFNADPAVLGATLRLTDQLFTVVGVAPEEFHGNTVLAPDLWMPFGRATSGAGAGFPRLVGARLKPGVSIAQAAVEIETIGGTLTGSRLGQGRRFGLSLSRSSPVPAGVRLIVAGFLALLMAIVMLVLVIASANVAGVLLARATARRRELAVRLAMGVGRARLVRQLFTETILLFALGGTAGLVLSRAMSAAIFRLLPTFPLPADVSFAADTRVVLFSTGIALAAALVSGLAPALQTSKVDVVSILKAHEHGPSSRLRLRHAFVVTQVALSVLLVVIGGLLTRALRQSGSVDQGFDPRGVEVAELNLSLGGYTSDTGPLFARDLIARARELPDVQAAALSFSTPSGGVMGFLLTVPGVAPPNGAAFFQALGNVVMPGYLKAMRIPLVAGRDFADTDSGSAERVVIVGESAVRRFWPGASNQDAIGRQILLQPFLFDPATLRPPPGAPLRVIGVARDLQRFRHAPQPFVYLPLSQRYVPQIRLLARTISGRRIAGELRALVTTMNPTLPILSATALEDEGGPVETQLRVTAAVSGSLGVVGFLLAAIGIYGVTAYMVTRRTREIGIRIAIGAGRADLIRMVLGEGMRLVAIGSAIGLVLAIGASRLLVGMLFGVSPVDPATFGGTVALFSVIGLIACFVPLRRALRIDAMQALRYE